MVRSKKEANQITILVSILATVFLIFLFSQNKPYYFTGKALVELNELEVNEAPKSDDIIQRQNIGIRSLQSDIEISNSNTQFPLTLTPPAPANYPCFNFNPNICFKLMWPLHPSVGGNVLGITSGIAIGYNNIIYVSQISQSSVKKFDKNGNYLGLLGSSGPGSNPDQFTLPRGISIDLSNNIYIADSGNSRISKFDSSGNFITHIGIGILLNPYDVTVDPSGNIFVADTQNNRIVKFDSNGNVIYSWGTQGFGPGQFNLPKGIEVDPSSGIIFVSDLNPQQYGFARIQKFVVTPSGTYTLSQTFGNSGNIERLVSPSRMSFDMLGDLLVTDPINNRVVKYNPVNGNYIASFGSYGTGPGQFNMPFDVAVDNTGNIYVVDSFNNRIQKFS